MTLPPPPVPGTDGLPVVRRAPHPRRRRRSRALLALATAMVVGGLGAAAAGLALERRTSVNPATGGPPDLVAATPVLSARRTPELTSRPVAGRFARAATAPVIARAAPDTCVVVGDGTDAVVTAKDTQPLVPASNLKLLTGAAALDLLGDAPLTTRFAAAGLPSGGVLAGDLYMVGGGDPLLTTDTYAARSTNGPRPATDLEAVADQLVAAGVTRITGSVVGDGSRYDDQRAVPSWPARFQAQNIVAPLSALVVNDGWLVDPVVPGAGPGGPAPDPAQHAADVMTALLRARGVQVDGAARSGVAPAGATTVLEVPSPDMDALVGELTAFSDNTTAELLLKEIGRRKGGSGTTAAGAAAVTAWATAAGLPTEGFVMADGSGLSADNRLTCRLLAAVLQVDGATGPLSDGLARPGQPGTLDDRFTQGPLRDRLSAKTGTLTDVVALSGWLLTVPGTPLHFSIVTNTPGRAAGAADLAVQTDLLSALLAYPVRPPREQLVPLPPAAPG